jgi:hypothetical protein
MADWQPPASDFKPPAWQPPASDFGKAAPSPEVSAGDRLRRFLKPSTYLSAGEQTLKDVGLMPPIGIPQPQDYPHAAPGSGFIGKALHAAGLAAEETGKSAGLVLGPPGLVLRGGAAVGPGGSAIEPIPPEPLTRAQRNAQRLVARVFAKDAKAGGPTATEVLDQFAEARQEGQPITLPEVGGKGVQRFAGSVYRGPGAAGTIMKKFYDAREKAVLDETLDTAAGARIASAIDRYLAPGSARQAAKALAATRSANARPLWDKAMEGGSIAPLESQFEDAFRGAAKEEADASKAFQQSYQKLTLARGKQSQAGNVYSTSAVNREVRDAQAQLRSAETALSRATADKGQITSRLRQAQSDRTAEAKGAVWSPRLQKYLDHPIFKEGLRKGQEIERLKAINEGRPFNPYEYAIVGEEADGTPKVGPVPNMKLLQMAKEGVDAMLYEHEPLRQNPLTDPLTGRRTKWGREVENALHEFVSEADRFNPDWKPARDQWSGDTASLRALRDGANMFKPGLTVEQLQEDFAKLPPGDKELFRMGAANDLQQDVDRTAGDPSKAIIRNTEDRKKLRAIFDTKQQFDKFRSYIEREKTMYEVPYHELMGGSQTVERGAADADAALHGLRALWHGARGNVLGTIDAIWRAAQHLPARAATNEEVARLLANPGITLATGPGGKLSFDVNDIMRRAAEIPRQPVSPSP